MWFVNAADSAWRGPEHRSRDANGMAARHQASEQFSDEEASSFADPVQALSTTIPRQTRAESLSKMESDVLMTAVCEICGLPLSGSGLDVHIRELIGRVDQGRGAWLLTLNTEMLARGARDLAYWSLVKKADIITADGMPLVWASKFKRPGHAIAGRTTGVDLVDGLLRHQHVPAFAVIGGQNPRKTIEQYGSRATEACAFVFDGKVDLSESQVSFFCQELTRHQVRLVFIALGVPKQDQLAVLLRQRMPQLVLLGIGGTFEILGPDGSRAPVWMQRVGLEWFFRLAREPGRLWRRYLINYPRGIWFLVRDCLGAGH